MALVGYGEENGVDYWILRNSLGYEWGDSGYIYIRMGFCGVEAHVYAPVFSK